MKSLIAVATCHVLQYRLKALAQRVTWVKDVRGVDVRFFCGRNTNPCEPNQPMTTDEVWLDCPDSYAERKEKIKAIFRWALDHGYDRVYKIDDDVYLRPERLVSLGEMDYGGWPMPQKFFWGEQLLYETGTVLGAFYVLSRKAMEKLFEPDAHPVMPFEDCWVSLQLKTHGIEFVSIRHRLGYQFAKSDTPPKDFPNQEPPSRSNDVVASWEYTVSQLLKLHAGFSCGS